MDNTAPHNGLPRNHEYNPYVKSLVTVKISLHIIEIGKNLEQILGKKIADMIEGKCTVEGFIQPDSVHVLTYSAGTIVANYVSFVVAYECMVCNPTEGMVIEGTVKSITKVGIHAEVIDEAGNIPIVFFIAKEHNLSDPFVKIKENDVISATIIGTRFELTNESVTAIAHLNPET